MLLDPGESSLRRHYNPSPLIDSAGGRGLALYRFVALVYAGILVGIHQEHVIRWWPILLWGACALVWSVVAPPSPPADDDGDRPRAVPRRRRHLRHQRRLRPRRGEQRHLHRARGVGRLAGDGGGPALRDQGGACSPLPSSRRPTSGRPSTRAS
ncbi:hypothetical protein [Janibacter hoylei]|uniref:hypothetical protein n=1 Tax=Janibacter hoylei TaxID=364298 RepID=UPI0012EAD162|nr:hypothetical protein [Janibacter hoylei]